MKRFLLSAILFILITNSYSQFQTITLPVDTSQYTPFQNARFIPNPEDDLYFQTIDKVSFNRIYFAWQKKGTSLIDIFSFSGKEGSVVLPDSNFSSLAFLSQKFIDSDNDWEYVSFDYRNSKVYDSDGTILHTFDGAPQFGFDGDNTYLIMVKYIPEAIILRSDISASSAPALSKTTSGPRSIMVFGASGNYDITLQPAGAGKTSVQLFDFLGRTVFQKTIDNVTKPVTYSIPEQELPRTPFVAKVKSGGQSTVKKEIGVRR